MKTKICIVCTNEYEVKTSRQIRERKCCSHRCRSLYAASFNKGKLREGSKEYEFNKNLGFEHQVIKDYILRIEFCELCGKKEKISSSTDKTKINKFSRDHSHVTGKFRGALCCDCNRKLGWYEAQKDNIENYLRLNNDFQYVQEKINAHSSNG